MARYTTELRDIVKSGLKLFDFEYVFYDPTKKTDFEQQFIDHFLFREIGVETVGRFQHYLKVKCNEVLPFYNEMLKAAQLEYDVLNNYDMTETFEKTNSNTRALTENIDQEGSANSASNKANTLESETNHTENTDVTRNEQIDETGNLDNTSTTTIDGRKVGSDTPNGLLSMADIKGNVYASKADIEDTTNTTVDEQTTTAGKTGTTSEDASGTARDEVSATSVDNTTEQATQTAETDRTQNETTDGNENYTLTRMGNIGVMHATDMIEKHVKLQRKIRTVYTQFFNECEDLFMQLF